jgi:hypothetical protein
MNYQKIKSSSNATYVLCLVNLQTKVLILKGTNINILLLLPYDIEISRVFVYTGYKCILNTPDLLPSIVITLFGY